VTLAAAGHYDQAIRTAESIRGRAAQAESLAKIAAVLVSRGQHQPASVLAASAAATVKTTDLESGQRQESTAAVARELARAGELDLAATLALEATAIAASNAALTRYPYRTQASCAGTLAVNGQVRVALAQLS
jgi:hypothetical protein